ncbi:MAG: type II toxin-antitoxin system VapC family toxin [Verrucomicrobiaceae bacterium]|nr:type II toxin-antitoxin system VapC family toxin [Verrucomicrobiaceae bacterium]
MTSLYLLDTCAWLDVFIAPQKLRPEVRAIINQQSLFSIADITLLEVARKAQVGDLILDATIERWFEIALPPRRSRILPITTPIAIESSRLPEPFHKDPADRLIVATARIHGLTIITSDLKILDYPHVRSLASR